MKTREDIVRQASIFTTNGLIDPRVMPGYVASNVKSSVKSGSKLHRFMESLFNKFEKRQASM